jgi:hypothetical protein
MTYRLSDQLTSELDDVLIMETIRWWIMNDPLTIQKHIYHSVTSVKSPHPSKNIHIPRVEITRIELNKDAMDLFKQQMAEKYPEKIKKLRKQRSTTKFKRKYRLYPE